MISEQPLENNSSNLSKASWWWELSDSQSVTTHFPNCICVRAGWVLSHEKLADLSGNFHVPKTAKHQFVVKISLVWTSAEFKILFLIVGPLCSNLGFLTLWSLNNDNDSRQSDQHNSALAYILYSVKQQSFQYRTLTWNHLILHPWWASEWRLTKGKGLPCISPLWLERFWIKIPLIHPCIEGCGCEPF